MDVLNSAHNRRNIIFFTYAVIFIIIGLYFAMSGSNYYKHDSPEKLQDLIQAKIWLMLSILMGVFVYSSSLSKCAKLWGWIFTISIYFVVLYALFYKGTDYGLNGHWGDNGNRLALVTKYRDLPGIFYDWYFKDLPPFYPPLWFFLSGKLAWLIGVEGYKTIKLGYFVIYGFYPLVLFYIWGRVASKKAAFAIAFLTIFLRDIHLDYVYYEHFTAAFFIPWWLYYVEDIKERKRKNLAWYVLGGILGSLIFLTYYYWFIIGLLSIILRALIRSVVGKRLSLRTAPTDQKALMLLSVAVFSSIYWIPLLISIVQYGADSMQNKWFNPGYLNFSLPFFTFNFYSLIFLIGLIYLVARFRRKLNSSFAVFLLGMAALLLIERALNLNEISLQARKLREFMPVFLAVPSGFGVILIYRILTRRLSYMRSVIMVVFAVFVFFVGNSHSDITSQSMYRVAIDSRTPDNDIAVFRSVDSRGKVFLTNHYLEAVYVPYYMFICPNSAAAHTASRFHQRIAFLQYLGKLDNEEQVAYLLRRNCFNGVDYFYLPVDDARKTAYYDLYPLYFPGKNVKVRLEFPYETTTESKYFISKHPNGMYEVCLPDRSVVDIFIRDREFQGMTDVIGEFNRLNLAMQFLSDAYSDSLRPYVQHLKGDVKQLTDAESLFRFDRRIDLIDFAVVSDVDGHLSLRLIFLPNERLLDDYRIFVHAYPEDSKLLEGSDDLFRNSDFAPVPSTSRWIAGEYQYLTREVNLKAGRYKFHIGFFNRLAGRFSKSYWTDYMNISTDNAGEQYQTYSF